MEQYVTHQDFGKFKDDLSREVSEMSVLLNRLDDDFYNHGKEGLKTRFDTFMAVHEDRETRKKIADDRFRWIIGILVGIITIAVMLFVGVEETPKIHSILQKNLAKHPEQVYAKINQTNDAQIPPLAR